MTRTYQSSYSDVGLSGVLYDTFSVGSHLMAGLFASLNSKCRKKTN